MNLKNPFLFRFQWLELVEPDYGIYAEPLVTIREGNLEKTPKSGTEFFNMIRDQYLWELNDQSTWDLRLLKKKQHEDEVSYMVMHRAENRQCVIDNTRTSTSLEINNSPRYPRLSIGIESAKAMDWIVMGSLDDGQPGYVLGPNLRKEFPNHIVPKAMDLVKKTC